MCRLVCILDYFFNYFYTSDSKKLTSLKLLGIPKSVNNILEVIMYKFLAYYTFNKGNNKDQKLQICGDSVSNVLSFKWLANLPIILHIVAMFAIILNLYISMVHILPGQKG